MPMRERETRREGGFTLIELLIVIVVLGILAAIVLFAAGTAREDANLSACKADYKVLQTALEAKKARDGVYITETLLVTEGFIRNASPRYDVPASDGAITVQGGSNCPADGGQAAAGGLGAPALTIACGVGTGNQEDNITCSGTGAAAGSTVTIQICQVNSFPCSGGNLEATLAPTANGGGAYSATSGNLDDDTYFVRATQGALASPVVTQVVND